MAKIGILLINTGTPDAPTPKAVRHYLNEFLSDPRIVHLPRWFWLPLLRGMILPLRAPKSAKLYEKIWESDSPLRLNMKKIAAKLENKLNQDQDKIHYSVLMAMNYGSPNIADAFHQIKQRHLDKIIILPLFPQYSFTTTLSSCDRVMAACNNLPHFIMPRLEFIYHYACHEKYISALANYISDYWKTHGRGQKLLISFHGIPVRFIKAGDPYQSDCEATAQLLANALQLKTHEWQICYQSQFGYDKWLTPSTQALFQELPKQKIQDIDIVCPGFSVDCLETLEEIAVQGKKDFLQAGGKQFRYIPALNDDDRQIELIGTLCSTINT